MELPGFAHSHFIQVTLTCCAGLQHSCTTDTVKATDCGTRIMASTISLYIDSHPDPSIYIYKNNKYLKCVYNVLMILSVSLHLSYTDTVISLSGMYVSVCLYVNKSCLSSWVQLKYEIITNIYPVTGSSTLHTHTPTRTTTLS